MRAPARDGTHVVQAGGGIQHHVPGRSLTDCVPYVSSIIQLPAVILLGRREEERRRQIRADAICCPADLPDRVIDVRAEDARPGTC